MTQYGLPLYDANILTSSKAMATYFENCVNFMDSSKAKTVSNWLLGDFSRLLNATNTEIENVKISPEHLAEMLGLVDNNIISGPATKAVFEDMFHSGRRASQIVSEKKLGQIGDVTEITRIVKQVIDNNAGAVSDYNSGKQQALMFIVGQVMKTTRGRANPNLVEEILIKELQTGLQDEG